MKPTILVTGGSGYIAGFLIRQLVAQGWQVRTTVRSLAREQAVRKLLAVDDSALQFFAADLQSILLGGFRHGVAPEIVVHPDSSPTTTTTSNRVA